MAIRAFIVQFGRSGCFVVVESFFIVVDDEKGGPGCFCRDGFGLERTLASGEEEGEGLVGGEGGREDEGGGAAHLVGGVGGLDEDELGGVLFGGEEGTEVLFGGCVCVEGGREEGR